ncbi:hypothetical protein CS0771_45730 [Catellatospora sp. IY07-71]|uniref:DUF397 domain-containing protein n=1 Tax=Catellatospora sp. IY07-71 TaxID=2728827 RepID=UPI001BB43F45|nr:DUF397 domain-containing protein [Catellatospora sp. IY07-71]BCJ75029.1 hypothetical protein CS0771_45730 [Catellatospora sp. IY07-71]
MTDPCIDLVSARWRKSTRCDNSGPNCVEAAFLDGHVAVRDNKDPGGPALVFGDRDWASFVAGMKAGEFDR